MNEWQTKFHAWQAYADAIQARIDAIQRRQHDKGWSIAANVGIPRHACALHNASIDDSMTGWCAGNPARLAGAKAATRYLNDWRASRIGRAMIDRAYRDQLMQP
jgi:hypothetical protein